MCSRALDKTLWTAVQDLKIPQKKKKEKLQDLKMILNFFRKHFLAEVLFDYHGKVLAHAFERFLATISKEF